VIQAVEDVREVLLSISSSAAPSRIAMIARSSSSAVPSSSSIVEPAIEWRLLSVIEHFVCVDQHLLAWSPSLCSSFPIRRGQPRWAWAIRTSYWCISQVSSSLLFPYFLSVSSHLSLTRLSYSEIRRPPTSPVQRNVPLLPP
jgi:hypothetical protein